MLIFGSAGRQTGELELAAQSVDDAQNILKANGGFASFQINDETYANACSKR